LHEKGLGPIPKDLLYSHCQIRLNSKHFRNNSENTEIKDTKICCQSCESVLGDYSEKDGFVQIWHHNVILNDDTEIPSTALETFLLLIGGICADHDWIPLKIRLKSEKTETEVERNFVIWMLEPDLKVLKIQETQNESVGSRKELSLMKVMYNENSELQVDQELSVPEKIIQAGMGYLIENSVMIPKSQRKDSNFHISYINLNSVTSSETLLEKCANLHI